MKKLMALALALVLCVCAAAACAETTVQEKVIEAYNLELNTKADMLILTDRETGLKYVADTEGDTPMFPPTRDSLPWRTRT